jgi:hypothetical protein
MSGVNRRPVHDFATDMEWADGQTEQDYWERVYRYWFPDFLTRQTVASGVGQRQGRDTVVLLSNGESLKVQEKVRRRRDTGDILLEYEHRYPSGYQKPGWVDADSLYDYLAYVFVPSAVGYLFPFQSLRAAWLRYRDGWLESGKASRDGFRLCPAQNPGYVTWSLAVPTLRLYRAVGDALRVSWAEPEPATLKPDAGGTYRMERLI